ncbi:hypothetical protein AGABI1DRAFT_65220 [Agaricus bisporus var. burnettii JB137-S8]|uniref:Protein MON2 homolog n=1 Tax=Agaricus bisporus var. burnettii (strain JB137-S8 / ATCC MYA-4627 / FGSC 10392) TaxID=597362 RepID=K5WWC1_AGABU|nr:uncharacterized protein AGABI1DRAFT_65220 [Agaricus bisporus var. burnettii JB137-S8]EKM74882.1 hypothetical protein AGABI1DRAFT_65220 [Agaricus bisporus var. burnettii JB137-S8]
MSSLSFLVTELQSLASETRRKHPEVREAAEKSIAILRASPEQATRLATDGPQSDDLLRPVFMGCATKNAKVVAISLGSLQRLISLRAVPQSAVPHIITTMSDAMSQGVDIQLRILQTLVSLIPNFPHIHGELLGDALLLCFKLQESRIAVVSSTAAATLRQLVMFVVDKMVAEDRLEDQDSSQFINVQLPNGSSKALGPSTHDTFSLFEDLCLLANGEKPNFLRLQFLHKTFALELIESVLANYYEVFRQHNELILLLQHHLCPLLLKSLSDRPLFPLMLRCTRVIFLLLKQFSLELKTEAEVFLMHLIRTVSEESESESSHPPRPSWMRVLAMEILRGLCSDAELMRNIWARYDGQESESKILTTLMTALKRLITEKPTLLGLGHGIFGVGVQHDSTTSLSLDGVAGRVATAASATVSGVVGMMGSSAGLSLQGSSMKLQCIDQLDKADAPPIPEAYIYLLALQCLTSICEGLATFTGPLYTTLVIHRPRTPGDAAIRAPPALDISALPPDEPSTQHLVIVRNIIENGWPALLAALSFIVTTNLSDELFVEVLASYQAMTNVSGMLGLMTPRDAFFNSLAKFAVPTLVVSSLDSYIEPQTPRSATTQLTDSVGLTSPLQPPGLSERNMACLKVFVSSALFLAGTLGQSWFGVLEVLQNAEYVLTHKGANQSTPVKRNIGPLPTNRSSSNVGSMAPAARHPLLTDLDPDTMQNGIQRLFDASKNLEDLAFRDFVNALCRLSGEMIGMQTASLSVVESRESLEDTGLMSPPIPKTEVSNREVSNRRRVSGIHIPRTLRTGDFGISRLGGVAMLNIHRFIYRSPDIAWDTTTMHLLSVIRLPLAPQPIRIQAAHVLDEILLAVPRHLASTTGELQVQVQNRVLGVLSQQVVPDLSAPVSNSTASVELCRMGLETLHQILQASVYSLVTGWETIFYMLESVCRPPPPARSQSMDSMPSGSPTSPTFKLKPLGAGLPNEKSYTTLVKIAFQSLTLVCDSVSTLTPDHLRLCISTLGQFGRQADTNIALTAATSLLWSVSDAIQAKRKDAQLEPQYSELWMFLLFELLKLGSDARPEVRDGAIQTLFRTIQLYGSTLNLETWDECIWKVSFPLVNSLTQEIRRYASELEIVEGDGEVLVKAWDDSKILAMNSIGLIFQVFLASAIIKLESFVKAWDVFVGYVQDTVLHDNRSVSAPALESLEKAVKAVSTVEGDSQKAKTPEVMQRVWTAIDVLGDAVVKRKSGSPVTSPTLADMSLGTDFSSEVFTQGSLVAFVGLIQSARGTGRVLSGSEWDMDKLVRLVAILKGVLTYPNSPDYRPDVDVLPPVQSLVLETLMSVDLSVAGSPSLVMRDLSEYVTLPFMAAFDVQSHSQARAPQKRVTYIALAKKTMPMLVDLFLQFKSSPEVYLDGTVEALLAAYSIPIKLKYDCPAPSKSGEDLPLWKTATQSFLKVVAPIASNLAVFGQEGIPDDRVEGVWRQILDGFRGAILADCSAALSFPLDVQTQEEDFDMAVLKELEENVIIHIGHPRVPDVLVSQLARILHRGSEVYPSEDASPPTPTLASDKSPGVNHTPYSGTTELAQLVPRERFSYWCFDLLFTICCSSPEHQDTSRKRLAALSLPSLLNRCRSTLVGYVADGSLRGNLPFPRARDDELLYVLQKLLNTRVWPGSLWAALSDDPTKYAVEQPVIDAAIFTTPSEIMADTVKRSPAAILFHFYTALSEVASIPRWTPSTRTLVNGTHKPDLNQSKRDSKSKMKHSQNIEEDVLELDARTLARDCLKVLGHEMGVAQ